MGARMTWVRIGLLLACVSVTARAQFSGGVDSFEEVGEDFETDMVWGNPTSQVPRLLTYDGPDAGTAGVTAAAAHRGLGGLRFSPVVDRRLPDGGLLTGDILGPVIQFGGEPPSLRQPDAGLYFRTWFRVNTYATRGVNLLFFNFFGESGPAILPVDGGWQIRVLGQGPSPESDGLVLPLTWHLVEVEYVRRALADSGVGTPTDVRIWLDGALHARYLNLPLRLKYNDDGTVGYSVGLVQQGGGDLDGSVDYDDFRRSRRPPASALVAERGLLASSPCPLVRPVVVKLASSQQTQAPAPYRVALDVDAGPALVVGRFDGGCLDVGSIAIPQGAESIIVGVEGQSAGVFSVSAPDFIGTSLALPAFNPDARLDGGGMGDAGSSEPGRKPALLGSGCSSAGAAPMLVLVLSLRGRRRLKVAVREKQGRFEAR
jgi:hypothetical protein